MQNSKLKVFIDESPLRSGHAVRGIGSYTRSLIDALKQEKKIELVDQIDSSDLVHYPYFDLFFDTLKTPNKPFVVTVFDTIPLVYPKHYPTGIKGKLNLWLQKRKLRTVSAILTISETSKKDIVRFLGVPQGKIFVVHLAAAGEFKKLARGNWQTEIRQKYDLPDNFILYVGDVNYNKNIGGLIRAFALLNSQVKTQNPKLQLKSQNLDLVLVGAAFKDRNLPETKQILQLIEKLKVKDSVLVLGFLAQEDLAKIYNLATVYCQPSFYEGFGLSVLEAMACGCPVVAAKTQALVEIGDESCLFIDPRNPGEIAKALLEAASDNKIRDELVKKGMECVKNYSWQKTARRTLAVYRQVTGL